MRGAIVLALALLAIGCGMSPVERTRVVLDASARSVVASEGPRLAFQAHRDNYCREGDPTFAEWDACMDPADRIDTAAVTFRHLLLSAEHAVDVSGVEGWRQWAPCVADSGAELAAALSAAGLDVPEQVTKIIGLASGVAGECSL